MRIAIITFHRSASIGALLQSYALSSFLANSGHHVEILDYRPRHRDNKIPHWSWRYLGAHPQNLTVWKTRAQISKFTRDCLPVSRRKFYDGISLRSIGNSYDAFICGSDQIWNPLNQNNSLDSAYYLDFVPDSRRKIAFAPSFGSEKPPITFIPQMKALVSRLDFISLREAAGAEFLSAELGRAVAQIADPTVLKADYDELLVHEPLPNRAYILLDALQNSEEMLSIALQLSQKYSIPVYWIRGKWWRRQARVRCLFPEPREWLCLVKNARFIITNSFHTTVFCLIFERPFATIALRGALVERTERLSSLLRFAGIPKRLIFDDASSAVDCAFREELDWNRIRNELEIQRTKAKKFLLSALQ